MTEQSARGFLRILSVATVLLGAILVSAAVFNLIGMDASAGGRLNQVAPMAQAVVWGYGSIILWGLLLGLLSGPLARWIAR